MLILQNSWPAATAYIYIYTNTIKITSNDGLNLTLTQRFKSRHFSNQKENCSFISPFWRAYEFRKSHMARCTYLLAAFAKQYILAYVIQVFTKFIWLNLYIVKQFFLIFCFIFSYVKMSINYVKYTLAYIGIAFKYNYDFIYWCII